ncbi:peroxin 22 protein [Rutstroemia sp. NJR-2017a BBW]|nr:peroxin 22 protein [Rutstroemia sp. NJR-2017a BBW]
MPSPYDSFDRSSRRGAAARRGNLSYWLPLAFTVTAAAVGVVAWIWSTRSEDDEDDENGPPGSSQDLTRPEYGRNPDGSFRTGPPSYAGDLRPGETSYGTADSQPPPQPPRPGEASSYIAQMSGALQRTPSPQQFISSAGRSLAAGAAAVGGVVGSALSAIREEDKHGFDDHRTWQEEAESRRNAPSPPTATAPSPPIEMRSESTTDAKRKNIAIVVSAESQDLDSRELGYHHEHASILSHLPRKTDFSKIRLFVLIYAPGLKEHPLDSTHSKASGSLSSSFSNIGHDQAHTPLSESEPQLTKSPSAFTAVYNEAIGLVEKETMVLPFTTPTGHVHILRHLAPEFVYLQESLAGHNGEIITHLQSWLREDVVLVVGADGGHGGLADSDSEAEQSTLSKEQWWEREDRVGLGRGVVVVEGSRIGDYWARKVQGMD